MATKPAADAPTKKVAAPAEVLPAPTKNGGRGAAAGGEPGPGGGAGARPPPNRKCRAASSSWLSFRAAARSWGDGARQRPSGEEGGTGCGTEAGSGGCWGGGGEGKKTEKKKKEEAKQGSGEGFARRTRRGYRSAFRLPGAGVALARPPPTPPPSVAVARGASPSFHLPAQRPPRRASGARPVYMRGTAARLEPRRRAAGEGLCRGAAAGPRAPVSPAGPPLRCARRPRPRPVTPGRFGRTG